MESIFQLTWARRSKKKTQTHVDVDIHMQISESHYNEAKKTLFNVYKSREKKS